MAFDSLLFDLDGTLWDSTRPVTQAWNEALRKVGMREQPVSEKQIAGIMGMPHGQIFQTIFPGKKETEREKIAEVCYEEEIALIRREGAPLYPGVAEGLKALAARFPLFIVSNCQEPYLRAFFDATGFAPLFRDWECYGRTGMPKGDNICSVVKRHSLASPAFAGDTSGDCEAAFQAGVPYFHVTYGFGSPGRDCVQFSSFSKLVEFFL